MPSTPPHPVGICTFLRRVSVYLRPHRAACIFVLVLMVFDIAYSTGASLSFKYLIDDAIAPHDIRMLSIILGLLAGGFALAALSSVGRDYLYARLSADVLREVRVGLFVHLQRLSMEFYSRIQTGDILARLSSDVSSVETAVVLAIPGGLLSLMNLAVSVAILFYLEWRLALLTIFALPVCLIGQRLFGKKALEAGYRLKQAEGASIAMLQEVLSAQPVIKAYSLGDTLLGKFVAQSDELRQFTLKANFLNFLLERAPSLGIKIFYIAVLIIGSILTFFDFLTIGSLVAFQAFVIAINESVTWLTSLIPYLVRAATGMQRLDELFAEVPRITDAADALSLAPLRHQLEFKNVSFGYSRDYSSLADVDLRFTKGEHVALVGPSGSGKSTIINLLMRFYDPDRGTVCFDGTDIRQATQASLRARIGIVFQQSMLFNTTVRENIRMGRLDATDGEVEAAAQQAEIHDSIMRMPAGYDTPVGERGDSLSGGERQRLAVARAILRDPDIVVLDEATSALDPAAEAAILETVERVFRGRTVISVTHRLDTAARMNRIFVLDHGRLREYGTHDELLRHGGVYNRLWNKQSGVRANVEGTRASVDIDWLQTLPFLQMVNKNILMEIEKRFVTERFIENRDVILEGDRGDKFYIIVRGRVIVFRKVQAESNEAPVILEVGDYFGEIALLRDVPRTATVRTLTPSIFLTLNRDQFLDLMERVPDLRKAMEESHVGTVIKAGANDLRAIEGGGA
jgi:ATP-binding cassette, subfamily B, bacterial